MRIRQVFANLLDNAVRFTPAGHIRVAARNVTVTSGQSQDFPLPVVGWLADREWIIVSVEDTGVGIPAEHQAIIFDEFSTAGDGPADGHGLGLTIARKLVELHTGRIWVQSRIGHGSTFHVALPAFDELEPFEGETVQNVRLENARAIVLVITDQDENALALNHIPGPRTVLRGTRPRRSHRPGARPRIHPAAVIVDLLMPNLAGWDAVRRLKTDPARHRFPSSWRRSARARRRVSSSAHARASPSPSSATNCWRPWRTSRRRASNARCWS
jgi:CheY-like chemotaxis protein